MAYYSTFGEILTQMRSEARLSTNPAVSSDADTRYKALVNRVYSTLYESYDWPHLRHVSARVVLAAGQRFYDFPTSIAPEASAKAFSAPAGCCRRPKVPRRPASAMARSAWASAVTRPSCAWAVPDGVPVRRGFQVRHGPAAPALRWRARYDLGR